MRPWSLLFLLSSAFPILSNAQTPVIPHTGEIIEVSIVNVDTVVTDKQGRRVHGLRKEDFEIYENGVRQPISNFAEYASAVTAGEATSVTANAALASPPQPRTIVVFVERFELARHRSDPVFNALKKLLHATVRPGDRVLVVTWNSGVLGIGQDFTDNLTVIDQAIDVVAQRTTTIVHDKIADLKEEIRRLGSFESEASAVNRGRIPVRGTVDESGLSFFVEQAVLYTAKDALLDEKRKVRTLNALMRSVSGVEGKKILLLATHRLSLYAGAEADFATGRDAQLPSDFKLEFDTKPLIRSLIDTANANGFTIYPIYAEGLDATDASAAVYRVLNNETPILEYVAKETGGSAAWGSSDVVKLMPSIGEDIESYYSLAYRAPQGKAANRRIEIKVKNPTLKVRARTEYSPKSDTTRMDDRVIATLFGNPSRSSFAVRVSLDTAKLDAKNQYRIPVTIEVPIAALTTLPGPGNVHNGAFTVYMAFGAVLGGVSDTHRDTRQFSIPDADLAKAKLGHFTYQMDVAAATPYPRIALGVYDEVSKEYALNLIDPQPPAKWK